MNESCFAVERFVNDSWPVGVFLPRFRFGIEPATENKRPSTIFGYSPIFRDAGQVKSQVEAHDHRLIKYCLEEYFFYELGARAQYKMDFGGEGLYFDVGVLIANIDFKNLALCCGQIVSIEKPFFFAKVTTVHEFA